MPGLITLAEARTRVESVAAEQLQRAHSKLIAATKEK